MRFYEFGNIDEDLEAALDRKAKQLKTQRKVIMNRKKQLANQKTKKANRETIMNLAKT